MSRLQSSDEEDIPLVPRPQRPPTPEFGLRSYHSVLRSPQSTRSLARSPKATRSSLATFSHSSHTINIAQVSRGTQTFQHLKGRSVFSQTEDILEEDKFYSDNSAQTDILEKSDHLSQTDATFDNSDQILQFSRVDATPTTPDQFLQLKKELSAISQHLRALRSETHSNQDRIIAKLNTTDFSTEFNQIVAKLNATNHSITRLTKTSQSVRFVDIENNLNHNLRNNFKVFFKCSVLPLYFLVALLLIICVVILCRLLLQTI